MMYSLRHFFLHLLPFLLLVEVLVAISHCLVILLKNLASFFQIGLSNEKYKQSCKSPYISQHNLTNAVTLDRETWCHQLPGAFWEWV